MRPVFPGVIAGIVGVIRWHEYNAAAIHGYTATWSHDARRWSLHAMIVLADSFKMAQRDLVFVARTKSADWEWPIESHDWQGRQGPVNARLGMPKEIRRP